MAMKSLPLGCVTRRIQYVYRYENWRMFSTPSEKPKPFSSIPGLSSLPVVGGLHHFLPGIGTIGIPDNFFAMIKTLHNKFGPIVKMEGVFLRGSMLVLYEPEQYDQVYRAEDVTPLRPGFDSLVYYREDLRKETFGGVYGLTTAQGAKWRDFRTKVNPAMLKPKLVKLYSPGLDEISKEMVERLAKLDPKYIDSNFDQEMTRFSLESVALVGLGARLGCLEDGLSNSHPAMQLMQCARGIMDLSFKMELWPIQLWRYFETPMFKKLMKVLDTQWDISAAYIEQAKRQYKERGDVPDEDKSIIEKLLAIDEKVAIMMANEMLMAGIDTVAFVTTAFLYELAKNPEKQNKLREEIRSGDSKRRYLKACLKETLRLHPVVSSNLRRTTKEHVVSGYLIPKGVDVVAPNEYLSRLEKYYPQPSQFIPERWLVDKADPLYYGNAHPMVTLPFGFGVRMCIGRRIAELEMEMFVQRLVERYDVRWEGPPIKVKTLVMNQFQKPYRFRFEAVK